MRRFLATASLALLTACGGGAANNSSGNSSGSSAGNAAAPAAAPAGAAAASTDPGLAAYRADAIRACSGDVRRAVTAEADVAALCNCAVDRQMRGRTLAELSRGGRSGGLGGREAAGQCAQELGIRPGSGAAGNSAN